MAGFLSKLSFSGKDSIFVRSELNQSFFFKLVFDPDSIHHIFGCLPRERRAAHYRQFGATSVCSDGCVATRTDIHHVLLHTFRVLQTTKSQSDCRVGTRRKPNGDQ